MTAFARQVHVYQKECRRRSIPEETVMAFLVELAQKERYDLYLHYEEEMPLKLETAFTAGMERILNGEPMDHVLGYAWFYGYKMIVNRSVLIPRPETEELCAKVLAQIDALFPKMAYPRISCADVGTGSGAIAIALCKEEPRLNMWATDISPDALKVAEENAALNQASVTFMEGDMLRPLWERGIQLDVLVCNPPYIRRQETLEHAVVDYEPHVALFGGEDGLKFYRAVFKDCRRVLKKRALMAFEMGWDQTAAMRSLLAEELPDVPYTICKDMNGKDRMLLVYWNCGEEASHE